MKSWADRSWTFFFGCCCCCCKHVAAQPATHRTHTHIYMHIHIYTLCFQVRSGSTTPKYSSPLVSLDQVVALSPAQSMMHALPMRYPNVYNAHRGFGKPSNPNGDREKVVWRKSWCKTYRRLGWYIMRHQEPLGHIMPLAAWHDPCLLLSTAFQQVLSDIDDTLLCSGAHFPAGLGTATAELQMVSECQLVMGSGQ